MPWTTIVGKKMTVSELRMFVQSLDFSRWRPSLIVWHNTAAPTLAQWKKSADVDRAAGRVPGITRIRNLETYFRDQRGWSSGPHAFVADDGVWGFTPFNVKGTHSPSWNGTAIGIEMVGDYDREDDDAGPGLLVRKNTVALTAILCEKLGLAPEIGVVVSKKPFKTTGNIFLHKQDPLTTHDCPGADVARDHEEMVQEVREFMGHAGEHADELEGKPVETRTGTVVVPPGDWLNLRDKASASSFVVTKLSPGVSVVILNEDMNGKTKWLYVMSSNGLKGWVAARYVKETSS